MVGREFKERLLDAYHGEQFGEAVFEAMLEQAENEEQRHVIGTLLQLETEGKAAIRPVLSRLGMPLDTNAERRAEGRSAVSVLAGMPWRDKFEAMAASIRTGGLPEYEALATLVSPEEDAEAHAIALFLGMHERAILAAAENLAANRLDALAPVNEILHFPLDTKSTHLP